MHNFHSLIFPFQTFLQRFILNAQPILIPFVKVFLQIMFILGICSFITQQALSDLYSKNYVAKISKLPKTVSFIMPPSKMKLSHILYLFNLSNLHFLTVRIIRIRLNPSSMNSYLNPKSISKEVSFCKGIL